MNHLTHDPFVLIQLDGALRLLVAGLLGIFLGVERSLAGKHAGMRTYALVTMGSALFVIVGNLASFEFSSFGGTNPLQIAASIVLGIGFIGSGLAFLRNSAEQERPGELTTASGVWVAAGVGMACGYGLYFLALCATLFAVLVFTILMRLELYARKHYAEKELR